MVLDFIVMQRGRFFFCVSRTLQHELAPAFESPVTATEIAYNVNNRVKYFNAIPLVPLGTPYPRPDAVKASAEPYPDYRPRQ